eukprot:TRINITY_DN5197_c0_g1_i2.p1 TRINITY_DN5197_c0_g1~~TRINITY_DN5197_c0_g1_i2.p1  ORF type:complete len:341 (+),score=59.91 TRINITY_DN5197_c0_g1_i2:76-1098(+)
MEPSTPPPTTPPTTTTITPTTTTEASHAPHAPPAPRLLRLAPPSELSALSRALRSPATHDPSPLLPSALRIRPLGRNPRSVSLPDPKDPHEPDLLNRSSPPLTIYFSLHANGFVQKRLSQRPSSSCFGFRFRIPNQGEVIFQSHSTPSTGMDFDDTIIYTGMAINQYFETHIQEYTSSRHCLLLGCPTPVTGVYLSYILHNDCAITLAELPGICNLSAPNTRVNCQETRPLDICEFPWDEDDYTGASSPDLVVVNTCSFMNPSLPTDQAVLQMISSLKKITNCGSKVSCKILCCSTTLLILVSFRLLLTKEENHTADSSGKATSKTYSHSRNPERGSSFG